jgi:hypothetical protein
MFGLGAPELLILLVILGVLVGVPVLVVVFVVKAVGKRSVPPPSSAPEGRWAPDPFGRHELRFWDGRQWTSNVSDRGVEGHDPPQ